MGRRLTAALLRRRARRGRRRAPVRPARSARTATSTTSTFDPPKHEGVCDQDGKPLMQRKDDEPETVQKRLATYHETTEPLIDYYDERGLLRRFDGTREPDRGPRPHPGDARDAAARER